MGPMPPTNTSSPVLGWVNMSLSMGEPSLADASWYNVAEMVADPVAALMVIRSIRSSVRGVRGMSCWQMMTIESSGLSRLAKIVPLAVLPIGVSVLGY